MERYSSTEAKFARRSKSSIYVLTKILITSQRTGTANEIFSKWSGNFRSDRTNWSKRASSGGGPLRPENFNVEMKSEPFISRPKYSWIFSKIFLHSFFTPLFSLKCAPLLPQCWAMRILEHWDDCNTQINIGEGETHTGVSRLLTSIVVVLGPSSKWYLHVLS